jgi:cytidine deaminase
MALSACLKVRKNAYAPYSRFLVGAAAVGASGRIYPGCNVESADYTLTTHAEMNAVNMMIAAGERRLKEMFICLASGAELPVPCGLCRQKMSEFADRIDIPVFGILLDEKGRPTNLHRFTLDELLPHAFGKSHFLKGTAR